MNNPLYRKMLASLARHGLTAMGGAGLAVSDGQIEQVVAAMLTIAGVAMSVYKEWKAARASIVTEQP